MQHLNEYDEFLVLREEGVHSEARRVSQDSEDHRRTPAEPLERRGENSHREDLGDLTDTHDRHDPVAGNTHAASLCLGRQEDAGPVEVTVVHKRVHERHEPQHE